MPLIKFWTLKINIIKPYIYRSNLTLFLSKTSNQLFSSFSTTWLLTCGKCWNAWRNTCPCQITYEAVNSSVQLRKSKVYHCWFSTKPHDSRVFWVRHLTHRQDPRLGETKGLIRRVCCWNRLLDWRIPQQPDPAIDQSARHWSSTGRIDVASWIIRMTWVYFASG